VPTIKDILSQKGSHVLTVGPSASVLDAATLMNEQKVGALVVAREGRVVGMFSERDVLQRIVAQRRDPATTLVEQVMTVEVVCGTPETTIDEARGCMKNRRIRHLPIVDDNQRLLGLISIGDLNAHQVNSQEQTIHLLHEYLYGRV
jgi:CBS domain-containing protein